MKKWIIGVIAVIFIFIIVLSAGFFDEPQKLVDRESKIPSDAVKMFPEDDDFPPILHSVEYEEPVPVPYPINTAGGEDSPFIIPNGETLYFFFTPDVEVPVEEQVLDEVTGIYVANLVDGEWTKPERVVLQDRGKLALDGCPCVQGDTIWFCSAREGYTGIHFFTAEFIDGKWQHWVQVEEKFEDWDVGELHITSDGTELYFHSFRDGGKGNLDIWYMKKVDCEWQEPVNVNVVNTVENEGWPFISQDGEELWFNRFYQGYPALFRSKKVDGEWQDPELIMSQFAAEPTLDDEGNLYFVHHFFKEGKMIEADIYVAYKKEKELITPLDLPTIPSRGFFLGFLPTPADEQSFEEVYLEASELIEVVPVWGRPSPFYQLAEDLSGSWGNNFVRRLIRYYGMFPMIHVSFIGSELTLSTPPGMEGATLSDSEWREAYKTAVLDVVRASRPYYLSIGNEVNRWYEKYGVNSSSPNGFQHYVSLYEETYDEVKDLSPNTIVFCTFSREIVAENREADLEVLDMFDPNKIDMLVFTSYPFAVESINAPEDIPDNYYKVASDHMPEKPFGFSELGWPSIEEFGGEEGQADFLSDSINRLTTAQNIDLRLLSWIWLTDLDESDHVGLKMRDGTEKSVYNLWMRYSIVR